VRVRWGPRPQDRVASFAAALACLRSSDLVREIAVTSREHDLARSGSDWSGWFPEAGGCVHRTRKYHLRKSSNTYNEGGYLTGLLVPSIVTMLMPMPSRSDQN